MFIWYYYWCMHSMSWYIIMVRYQSEFDIIYLYVRIINIFIRNAIIILHLYIIRNETGEEAIKLEKSLELTMERHMPWCVFVLIFLFFYKFVYCERFLWKVWYGEKRVYRVVELNERYNCYKIVINVNYEMIWISRSLRNREIDSERKRRNK